MFLSRHSPVPARACAAALLAVFGVAGCGGGSSPTTAMTAAAPPVTPPVATMIMANNLTGLPGAALVYPGADGKFDEGQMFEWSPVEQVQSYRLEIGSASGLADVYDSGDLSVTRVRVPGLPTGVSLPAELATTYTSGEIAVVNFDIVVSGQDSSFATRLGIARGLVLDVRNMAGENNIPAPGSILASVVQAIDSSATEANCVGYADTMLLMITQMNLGLQARRANTCLVPNLYDCHTLVELYDESSGRWILADPTFGLAPHNASDGSVATLDQMHEATRTQSWDAITYEFLTPSGDSFAKYYYLDYPLLFANTYVSDSSPMVLTAPVNPNTVSTYFQTLGSLPAPGEFGPYALRCPAGAAQVTATVDGHSQTYDCDPALAVTKIFLATTAEPPSGVVLLAPIRVHFSPEEF